MPFIFLSRFVAVAVTCCLLLNAFGVQVRREVGHSFMPPNASPPDWHFVLCLRKALDPDGVNGRKTVEPGGHFDYTDARHVRPFSFIGYSRLLWRSRQAIFRAQISLSDMDRNLYQDFSLTWPVTLRDRRGA